MQIVPYTACPNCTKKAFWVPDGPGRSVTTCGGCGHRFSYGGMCGKARLAHGWIMTDQCRWIPPPGYCA